MSQESTKKPLAIALGAAFVTSLAATPVANATANPFAMSDLSSGYMVAEMAEDSDKAKAEGKCGEGKCGANKKMMEEGRCGASKTMTTEGSDKAKAEGKCGEGKCGANKKMMEEGMSGGDAAGKEGN